MRSDEPGAFLPFRMSIGRIAIVLALLGRGLGAQTAGNVDPTFDAGAGPNGEVRAIVELPDGRIVVGGMFTAWGGVPRGGLVRLQANGTLDAGFNPPISLPAEGGVSSLAVATDGSIYAAGTFAAVDGLPRRQPVRFKVDGSLDPSFASALPAGATVQAMVSGPDDSLIVGGGFTLASPPHAGIVRLTLTGGVDISYGPLLGAFAPVSVAPPGGTAPPVSIPFSIQALAVGADGRLVAGISGAFSFSNGQLLDMNPVRFSPTGVLDRTNPMRFTQPVNAVAVGPDGAVFLGGLLGLGPAEVNPVRRMLASGQADASFAPGFQRVGGLPVQARCLVLEPDGRVVVGGEFDQVNGLPRRGLVRLLMDGKVDTRFAANAALDGVVLAVTPDRQGRILIGGTFSRVQGTARARIARLLNPPLVPRVITPPAATVAVDRGNVKLMVTVDAEPGLSYRWFKDSVAIPGATSPTLALVDVRAGGSYRVEITNRAGTVVTTEAVLTVGPRVAGAPDPMFRPEASGVVISRPDGRLLVANRNIVALLNADGSIEPGFQLDVSKDSALTGSVLDGLVLPDGKILLRVMRASAPTLERYLADGTRDASFAISGLPVVNVASYLVQADGSVVLGGIFDFTVSTPAVRILVRVDAAGRYDSAFQPPAYTSVSRVNRLMAASGGTFIAEGVLALGQPAVIATFQRFLANGAPDPSWVLKGGIGGNFAISSDGSVYRYDSDIDRTRIVKLKEDGSVDPTFTCEAQLVDERPGGRVILLPAFAVFSAQSDGRILVSGNFGRINNVAVRGQARILANGSLDSSFVAPTYELLGRSTISEIGGQLYAIGEFREINGLTRPGLARLFRDGPGQSRVINLSARARAGLDEQALFAGFVIGGRTPRRVLARGVGPSLREFGLADALGRAQIELYRGDIRLAANTDWSTASADIVSAMQRVGAFGLMSRSADAALSLTLSPGAYTTKVFPNGAAPGVALAEIYDDSGAGTESVLVNLAARAEVDPAGPPFSVGFVVTGSGEKQVLLRAVGPTLASFGVTGVMANPRIVLMGAKNEIIATNDDWWRDTEAEFAVAAGRAVGAFDLVGSSRDAAILRSLPPGSYTALVDSSDATRGVALIEVYEVTH